jgi:hypothetical protein
MHNKKYKHQRSNNALEDRLTLRKPITKLENTACG